MKKDKSEGPAPGERGKNGKSVKKRPRRKGVLVQDLLTKLRPRELSDVYNFWSGERVNGKASEREMRAHLVDWMADPARIEERLADLGRRLGSVVESLVRAPRYQRSWQELVNARALSTMSTYDLEACISALGRRGFVMEADDARFESYGERVVGMPVELGDGILRRRRERSRGIFGLLTLRGHLDQSYAEPSRARRITSQRLRELYKMYSQETASVARIERLPEGIRGLVEKVILEFGGILPRQLFERLDTDLPHWNGRRWQLILEQSLVGTVQDMDLSSYGINLQDETLIIFNEVALAWLRRRAVPSDPDRPHEELSLGIDLASNISRFLSYITEHDVRYTVRGEVFKTTEKKIIQHLIPNPGRELSREDVFSFVFRFARHAELIDRTGKRTFTVTAAGRGWNTSPLADKQRALFEFALDDQDAPIGGFHQLRMRQIVMRLMKRIEKGVWYDLMYLPFLSRNTYLSSLDDMQIEELFAEHSHNGSFPAMEDPQRLAWNLVRWIRQRLYLLGLVDLGYDKDARPVAMRLTPGGARLIGLEGGEAPTSERVVGSIVVTPDFEVVLFPTGDDLELVHDLDRFCVREKLGSLMHFRVSCESVQRALKEGMPLSQVLTTLENNSRTPVPQNVLFSIRDWAVRAGLMVLSAELVLQCEEADTLKRLLSDPGTRNVVSRKLDAHRVQLVGKITPLRMQTLLRELGYVVELKGDEA